MLLSRYFLPIILAPFIAAEGQPESQVRPAEEADSVERLQMRLQDRFRLFRDIIGAKDESHLAQIRQSLYRALVLEYPSTNGRFSSQTVDQVFSILPITMPPAPSRTDPATVTVTSVASAMPIESSVLERMFQSLMEKHLESILKEGRSRATHIDSADSASETGKELDTLESGSTVDYPEKLWVTEEAFADPVSEASSVPTVDMLMEESSTPLEPTTRPEQRKGGTKNKHLDVKHSNKIQVVPQFRHHDKEPVVIGKIYGKPKTVWYGEYARKPISELAPTVASLFTTEAGTSLAEVPVLSDIASFEQWETESDTESALGPVYFPETVMYPTPIDAPLSEASKEPFDPTSSHLVISPMPTSSLPSVKPQQTPRRSKPSRTKATFNINEHPYYATVSPRTPEEIQSNRDGRRRSRAASFYGVFASTGVQHHTSSLTIGIVVFVLVLVLL